LRLAWLPSGSTCGRKSPKGTHSGGYSGLSESLNSTLCIPDWRLFDFGRGRKATMESVVIWLKARSFDFGGSEKWCHRQDFGKPESLCCAVSCWQMRILSFPTRARTVGQPREAYVSGAGVHSIFTAAMRTMCGLGISVLSETLGHALGPGYGQRVLFQMRPE
jgi:hypothetical protein